MENLKSNDPKVQFLPLNWFNILIKHYLLNLNFFEFGRTRKFYDIRSQQNIHETKMAVLRGFSTSFQFVQSGLTLKIDISHKLIRQDNALQVIKQIYHDNATLSKDEKREKVRDEMMGCQVIVSYANHRRYFIDDVWFDKNTSTYEIELTDEQGTIQNYSLDQYFKQRYNIEIIDKKAPLLVNMKADKPIILIAELCMMAGVPKNFDEFLRKKVSQHCISEPYKRLNHIQSLTKELKTNKSIELPLQELQKQFGIEIKSEGKTIKAKNLEKPTILFGKNQATNDIFNGGFSSSKYPAFIGGEVSLVVIHSQEFQYREFEKALTDNLDLYGLTLKKDIKHYKLQEPRHRQMREIEELLRDKVKDRYSCAIIVIERHLKNQYKEIKQITLLKTGILSQVVLQDTLMKRGIKVITSKVVQQICSKIGNTMWSVQKPLLMPAGIILMSAMVSPQQIIGLCASIDENFTKFYNQTLTAPKTGQNQDIPEIGKFLEKAIKAYVDLNKANPTGVIYFREGLDDETILQLRNTEIKEIEKVLSPISCKFTIINEVKSSMTKLFYHNQNKVSNPPFGTVIDSEITSHNYDFYMVSQHATRGSVAPTFYRVVHDTLQLPLEMIERVKDLIYGQCYNYQNTTGAIKVPAIIQNAQRLGNFVGQYLKQFPKDILSDKLFYL